MGAGARLAAGAVSLLLGFGVAALSQWPVRSELDHAVVRLSWRTEPVRVETCRTLTPEELEGVPAHMRRAEECVGAYADYELRLQMDDGQPRVDTLSPSGLREDRPVYVLIDTPVVPGAHSLVVTFTALVPADYQSDDPLTMSWSGDLDLDAGDVALVTTTPAGTGLVRVDGADR